MKQIGILYHPQRADSCRLAGEIDDLLSGSGREVWHGIGDDESGLRSTAPDLEMVVTLGGDGTIIRAARALAALEVPILGVNLGRLGFLAEVEPGDIAQALPRVLAGEYAIEARMMLHVELRRQGALLLEDEIVNEAFVGRGRLSRMALISVQVDGHQMMTQNADGLIVSTPTGSTAYCLSAGGPIVAPDLECLTITPVAPHLSLAHAVVIPANRQLCLELLSGQDAMLALDGHLDTDMLPGDKVFCGASQHRARFVRFGSDGAFYENVLRRLRWPDRSWTR
ncbi:MAG: NAD(+)/NADH kinase [Chloroflexi bacterium]|nr:NAD(+)/NADH kinase [Chloroflexota bacterium]